MARSTPPLPRRRRGDSPASTSAPASASASAEAELPGAEAGTRPPGAFMQIVRMLGVGLSIGILLIVIALAAVLLVVPKATGSVPLTILTQSMEPTLPPGTLIVVRPVDTDALEIGDVATYQIRSGDPAVITHRIIAISSGSDGTREFSFQGDNNAEPDSKLVTGDQIQGEVWYSVPLVGWANQAANGEARGVIIPGIAIALLVYAAVTILVGAVQARRRRRAGPSVAELQPAVTPPTEAGTESDAAGRRDRGRHRR